MAFFRVEDTFGFHHKAVLAGNAAVGLWARAGSWSMQTLSDGFIPDVIAAQLGTTAQAKRLVDVGLWDRLPTGYAFHEWDGRNPSKGDVVHMRETKGASAQYGNHIKWHRNRDQIKDDCTWCQRGEA